MPIIVGKGHIVKVFEVDQQRCRLSLTNGAEYEVLGRMVEDEIRRRVLMFTIEGENALLQGIRWTKRLRGYGYRLVGLDKWAATFVIR